MSEEKRVATAEILNTSVRVSVNLNDRYQGPPGPPGKDGTVRFEDLTAAQIEQLRGPQGLTGATPQITVQVETGEPGTEASVIQSGTAEAPVIALTIPRGDPGATPQITVQVKTGEPGTAASVKQTGTAEAPVIELTIPRGDTGSLGSLTINGKTPDSAGKVELTAADVGALSGTDATLTQAEKAADAKATGDMLNQLKAEKADNSIISDVWQSGETYNAGAYCIYNNNLYRALVQTTAEPTSKTDWEITTVLKAIGEKTKSRLKSSPKLSLTNEVPIDLSDYVSENFAPTLIVFGRDDTYFLGIKDAWGSIITVGKNKINVSGTTLTTTSDQTITGFVAMVNKE